MKGIIKNTVKKLFVFILLLIIFLGVNTISRADSTTVTMRNGASKTFSGNMPQRSTAGPSGLMPQYYMQSAARNVTLDNNRFNWKTNQWTATMSGEVVYCSAYGRYVRYGKYDPNVHYLKEGEPIQETTLTSNVLTLEGETTPNTAKKQLLETIASWKNSVTTILDNMNNDNNNPGGFYYTNTTTGTKGKSSDTINIKIEYKNADGTVTEVPYNKSNPGNTYVPAAYDSIGGVVKGLFSGNGSTNLSTEYPYIINQINIDMQKYMLNTLGKIGPAIKAGGGFDPTVDGNGDSQTAITAINGPEVVVIEHTQGQSNGYASSNNEYTFKSNNTNNILEENLEEIQKSFIFSAAEDVYGNENYAQKYSLNDIQGAYWLTLNQYHPNTEPIPINAKLDTNAVNLFNKSKEYVDFIKNVKENGYHVSINKSEAQVIADRDRDNKKYIIGPFSINYTEIADISYLKSLILEDENGNKYVYDEKNNDFQIVLYGEGTKTNGMLKEYPKSGQKFFVIVSTDKIGIDTLKLNLTANCEYIDYTEATVLTTLTANANIYRYIGYTHTDNMTKSTLEVYMTYKEGIAIHEDTCGYLLGECTCTNLEYENVTRDYAAHYYIEVFLPYIKMRENPVRSASAQKLIVVGDAKRDYKIGSATISGPIDLTMELGGYVWVDADGGKEDISNGLFDNTGDNKEIKVPNVPVKLYRKDNNELIGTTKTNSNGEYRFEELNAMYQYYVVFTYNGQYYQPTTFADATTWGTENWTKNSNAKDIKSVREAYNLKFESIGPAPENYESSSGNYNETFTKLELLGYTLNSEGKYEETREAVIDDFGNLILENSTDPITKKMIEYVKDCMIDASTIADGANGYYPYCSKFLIANAYSWGNTPTVLYNEAGISGIEMLYNNAYYINLGLDERQQSDLAVKKDIQKVTLEINGQTHDYTYDTLEDKANAKEQWDISVRLADHYYNTSYTRAIYESDYMYKTSMYGDAAKYGKSEKDELEVYITYKIMIDNQANSIQAKVNEIADYYDKDLEYIEERSYIEIKEGENKGKYSVKAKEESRYTRVEEANIDDEYENLYIIGLDDKYLEGGQRAYIYLTFRVEKDTEGFVKIDKQIQSGEEIVIGKENLVEINGYSTRYAKGTQVPNVGDVSFKPAGIVDRDSKPGNLKDTGIKKDSIYDTDKTVYTKFEDDNDKSPNLKLIVLSDYAREISGNVWEDLRDENINETATGNGIRSNNENTLIDGVTVQLVELMDNGTEYVWREFGDKGYTSEEFKALSQDKQKEGIGGKNTIGTGTGTGTKTSETPIINAYNLIKNYEFGSKQDGAYAFKSFVPGKYVVRFIYGDTVKTVAPKSLNMGGLNEKSYNGQDYKSTTYQEGITLNKTYEWRKESTWELGTEKLGDIIRKISTYDKNVCNQNEKGTYLHDISAADKNTNVSDAKDIQSIRNAVNAYSKGEIANYLAEVLASGKAEYNTMNNRTQLFNDLIQNTKMTAETGVIVIELEYDAIETDGTQDRTYKVQNVNLGLEERPKAQLIIDKEVANAKITLANGSVLFDATNTTNNVLWKDHKAYDVGYVKGLMDSAKFGSIENIRKRNAKKFGLVQISMDEELMHGATIQITYKISAINVGEVDYNDNSFYYTGNVKDKNKVVTSNAKQVIDYVANNLQFSANKNGNWKQISKAEIQSQGLVNEKIINELDKYNTIITSTSLDKELVPSLYKENVKKDAIDTVSTQLVLTKVISPENDTDDLTYRNIVEIVKTTNTAGRRMEYSVVGNQIPGQEPQELDTDIAEAVKILPPFGNAGIYIIITITAMLALTIIILGTIFIKKKVLRK